MLVDSARYHAGARDAEATSIADAARLSRHGQGFVWVAVSQPAREELDELSGCFDLPALAVKDALDGHQRPKLEQYGGCVLLVTKTALYDETTGQLDIDELDIFVGARYAIAVSRSAPDAFDGIRRRFDEHPAVTALGPTAALWAVLETMVNDAERVTDLLLDRAQRIEQSVFQGDRDQSEAIYLHHRRVDQLGRAAHPVLAVFDTLQRGEPVMSPDGVRALLRDASDHARRLSEELVLLSGRLDGLLSANLSRVTVRQNVIMQKVSAWAAIAAAPTIITGIYGMNFRHIPELTWPFGYAFALVVMVAAVWALHWNFRRVGWL
ncbi:magnesium and cobalt transport protein CorA [Georgenia yuyongxinii]|uniref:Magnesium and cobalt transport protein CorA n=1 Tax=Georgenia yuyongxinii TaxID=2589797 RepID=A0A552WN14_9MICO|nr:magnesium and cobalt transport protein CorA [Georgenia yuyongxinii]TRW44117.1 magnesium and cobalt transport protein CorA [Georgenia yuyongxinii]